MLYAKSADLSEELTVNGRALAVCGEHLGTGCWEPRPPGTEHSCLIQHDQLRPEIFHRDYQVWSCREALACEIGVGTGKILSTLDLVALRVPGEFVHTSTGCESHQRTLGR